MADLHLGTDIAAPGWDLTVGHDGDLVFTTGTKCLVADMIARLETSKGTYWRHPDQGMGWDVFQLNEQAPLIRHAMEVAIARELEQDPRLQAGRTIVRVTLHNLERIQLDIAAVPVGEGGVLNLVLGFDMVAVTAEVLGG